MADLDFDQIEAVLDSQQAPSAPTTASDSGLPSRVERSRSRSVRKRSRSPRGRRSRSPRGGRSRSPADRRSVERKRRYSPRSSRSRDHDRRRRRRSRSIERSRHRNGDLRRRSITPEDPQKIAERKMEEMRLKEEARRISGQEKRLREEDEKRKKEIDEARRDDLTVLILNLSLKASERDVWKFFSEKAGKVRDIQVIRDTRSGKSKGVGYVEFYTPTSVMASMALSGQIILDQPVIVQASQAEKNRAAKAAKQQQAEMTELGPMKLYVGGLVESLSALGESDLRQLFSPFGEVTSVDVHKDPYTGRCKGYAFIQFRNAQDAREAMSAMNGFEIGGKQIKVGYATDPMARPILDAYGGSASALQAAIHYADNTADNERLDDEGGGLLSGANPRISLMQKLQRTTAPVPGQASMIPPMMSVTPAVATLSNNICLEPLFTQEEIQNEGATFLDDVAEDVKCECSKYGSVVQVYINRQVTDGKVWVKFTGPDMAAKAHQAMTGRYFAGNKIIVSFIPEPIWAACVPITPA